MVNVEKLLKMVKSGDFLKFVKNKWWNVENCWWNIKNKYFAVIFFYTMDIKNIIFNPKFYQQFLPSLTITINENFCTYFSGLYLSIITRERKNSFVNYCCVWPILYKGMYKIIEILKNFEKYNNLTILIILTILTMFDNLL